MREANPHQQDGNWWNDRLGKLTGSRMAGAINFLKSGKESTERENLRYEIVAERISNTFADKYVTSDMNVGNRPGGCCKRGVREPDRPDRHRCRVHRPPAHPVLRGKPRRIRVGRVPD
jgi:hypothetical protein